MAQTAAEAVLEQRLTDCETAFKNLTKRCEVLKEVCRQLARNQGADWRRLVQRAAGELEARKAREEQVA